MSLLSTRSGEKRQAQLNRDDWIEAALDMLLREGVHCVQVTTLAKAIGVTRGSFYWHFETRDQLLDALLAEWRARNTDVIVKTLAHTASIEAGILDLFSIWSDHRQFDPELDKAIRDWSGSSLQVRELLQQEDSNRVEAIAEFFSRFDYTPDEAFIRARILYFTQLSYYSLNIREPDEQRLGYLEEYFKCFTGREIDPSMKNEFTARFIEMQKGENP